MKLYQKKKLLKQQIKKFLSRKKDLLEAVKPIDKKLSKLTEKLAAVESGQVKRTITSVDHAAGSYDVIEYGDEHDEQEII